MNKKILNEDSRRQLVNKSKHADNYKADLSKGKNRFERRSHSRVSRSTAEFNKINMDKLFKDDILDLNVLVHGETDDYFVRMSFAGVISNIQKELKNGIELSPRIVSRALSRAFDGDDVFIRCDCPDFRYRFGYWATKNNIIVGDPEPRPSDETNPNDTKGAGCKHILLVLNNNSWLMKVTSAIYNYINYIQIHKEKLYADVLYPALYGKEYTDDVQLGMFDDEIDNTLDNKTDDTETDDNILNRANKYARTKNQFKKGNQSGIQFVPKEDENEKQFDLDSLDVEEEE